MALPRFTTERTDWSISKKDGKFLKIITANGARDVLRRDQSRNRFPKDKKDYVTWVDRRPGMPELVVRFGGRISYTNVAEGVGDISAALRWIGEQLVRESPYGKKRKGATGFRAVHYEDAHLFMVNGRSVMSVDSMTNIVGFTRNFQTIKHTKGSKYQFVNTMPYAKRIETGATVATKDGFKYVKPWSLMAEHGVYKRVARRAANRFKSVKVEYKVLQLNLGFTMQANIKKGGKPKRMGQLYPVIVLTEKSLTPGTGK